MTVKSFSNADVSAKNVVYTKKGNPYKKSHVATVVGTGLGTAYAIGQARALKSPFVSGYIKRAAVDLRNTFVEVNKIAKPLATKLTKSILKGSVVGILSSYVLIGLALGAGANKIVNAFKAKAADKAAEKNNE